MLDFFIPLFNESDYNIVKDNLEKLKNNDE